MNSDLMIKDFIQLVSFDSLSFSERKTADWVIGRLEKLGFTVFEDQAGAEFESDTGNIYGILKGTIPGPPILFSAHMDVVPPGAGKKALVKDDGTISSQTDTVLGADDISGILEILYGIEAVLQKEAAHRDIEVLFTVAEEVYLKGSSQFDFSKIQAKEAYVLDLPGGVGTAARKAPSIISWKAEIQGRSSHAGFAPEEGIHAVQIAANAINRMQLGHIGDDTTFNVGTISGGAATNIVPKTCLCSGEIRSYDHEKALALLNQTEAFFLQEAKAVSADAKILFQYEIHMKAYEVSPDSPVITAFQKACHSLGLDGTVGSTFGGSDNNVFVNQGIEGLVLSCGMYQPHSTEEYTRIEDLTLGAQLVEALILT